MTESPDNKWSCKGHDLYPQEGVQTFEGGCSNLPSGHDKLKRKSEKDDVIIHNPKRDNWKMERGGVHLLPLHLILQKQEKPLI